MSHNKEEVKRVASEIAKLAQGMDPRDYLGAVELGSSVVIRAVWHRSRWPEVLDEHLKNVRQLTFDPEGRIMQPGKGN